MQFSSVWRKITGENGNLFKEMKYYNKMDIGGKGYITEQEFVDGWSELAKIGGQGLLRRFSTDADALPIARKGNKGGSWSVSAVTNSDSATNDQAASNLSSVFKSYAKPGEKGELYINAMQFSSIMRQLTGAKGNLFKEMQQFNSMDRGNKGYVTEQEFIDGWLKAAGGEGGSEMLRRLSDGANSGSIAEKAKPKSRLSVGSQASNDGGDNP
jgi:Ca2+-binding EF-hand superfamily protein